MRRAVVLPFVFVVAGVAGAQKQPTNPNHQNPPPTGVEDTSSTGRGAEPAPSPRTQKVTKHEDKRTKVTKKAKVRAKSGNAGAQQTKSPRE
jgi:hypothetical protein